PAGRAVGARCARALLPQAHAALQDQEDRGADGARLDQRPGSDRVLARTTRKGVGRMKVGVPTETKVDEYRVALTPAGARELAEHGQEVVIQAGAGEGSAITDADYEAQGARIVPDAEAVFGEADMVLKVKEPQPPEVALLRP